jgi:hypothetical protein
LLSHSADVNNKNAIDWRAMLQQATAARSNRISQDRYNLTMPAINAATDYLKILNTNRASDYRYQMLDRIDRQLNLDESRYIGDYVRNNFSNTRPTTKKSTISTTFEDLSPEEQNAIIGNMYRNRIKFA